MNKKKLLIGLIIGVVVLFIGVLSLFGYYKLEISKTGDSSEVVSFTIESGTSTSDILNNLKDKDLIRNVSIAKIYIKLHNKNNIQAGDYNLNKGMSLEDILSTFENGKKYSDEITITFVEGKRIPYYVSMIASNFNYSEEEIYSVISDKEYLNKLIDKYWFITDDILDKDIYYPLEGYLFPDTYNFSKDASIEGIFEVLIMGMYDKINPYKDVILSSNYSVHEIMTLASIVELEGASSDDRSGVAGVFNNRIKAGWSLGSDVTTYYAFKKDFSEELSVTQYNTCNPYNTRSGCFSGLPVGPICNFSSDSLIASIYPSESNYYYFVADKNKKTYFATTDSEFNNIINYLKKNDLWYTY